MVRTTFGSKLLGTALAMLVSIANTQAADSVAVQINPAHTGVQIGGLAPPFAKRWRTEFPNATSYPVIAMGMVYATTLDGNNLPAIFALDQADGHVVWSREMARTTFTGSWVAATYDAGRVFVNGQDGVVYAFDAANGDLAWSTVPPNQYLFSSSPTAANGVVYTAGAGSGGTVFAFSEDTGALLGSANVENGDDSSPTLSSDSVFVDYSCNQAYRFSLSILSPVWHFNGPCEGGGGATTVYDSGRLYTRDIFGYGALIWDAATGVQLGTFATGYPSLPAVSGNRLWVLSGHTMQKKDVGSPSAPTTKWSFAGDGNLNAAPLVLTGGGRDWLVTASANGPLYALDADTGALVWTASLDAGFVMRGDGSGMAASDQLLVIPNGNALTAFNSVPATGYYPLVPARLLDTRPDGGTVDGLFARSGRIGNGATTTVQIAGRGGVPATQVTAVALNITATQSAGDGYVTAWDGTNALPNASTLNMTANRSVPNLAIVPLASDGSVSLFASISTHAIVDVVGYFTGASALIPVTSKRMLDTRPGYATVDGQFSGGGALAANSRIDLDLAGRAGLPADFHGTAIVNFTVTDPTTDGFLKIWPTDRSAPATSSLNFAADQTVANLVASQVSGAGQVSIFNSAGTTDVIADLLAWFPYNSDFVPLDPTRLLDTRIGATTVDGQFAGTGAVGSQSRLDLAVIGRGGVPSVGVGAVVLNVTATQPTASGFVAAWPDDASQPAASNLNFNPNETTSNLVICKIGSDGKISLFNSAGSTHLIADVVGWLPSKH